MQLRKNDNLLYANFLSSDVSPFCHTALSVYLSQSRISRFSLITTAAMVLYISIQSIYISPLHFSHHRYTMIIT